MTLPSSTGLWSDGDADGEEEGATDAPADVDALGEASCAPASGDGITWGTVLTAVFVALVAGGLVGNVFASHRRTPARPSVYGTIQRRIDAERSGSARP